MCPHLAAIRATVVASARPARHGDVVQPFSWHPLCWDRCRAGRRRGVCRAEVERLESQQARLAACRVKLEGLVMAREVIAGLVPASPVAVAPGTKLPRRDLRRSPRPSVAGCGRITSK
jgi:hypothetical protein